MKNHNTALFVNGVLFALTTGHIKEDAFWEILNEVDIDKDMALDLVLYGNTTLREILERECAG